MSTLLSERANTVNAYMTNPYLEHPTEEALERFLLQKSPDQELEVLETHILACETCVTRLETLELEMASITQALAIYQADQTKKELARSRHSWRSWLTVPSMSWAGAAAAAIALGCIVIPHTIPHSADLSSFRGVAEGDLSGCRGSDSGTADTADCRGSEASALPHGRPLDLHLETADIPSGTVDAEVVDGTGKEIWKGRAVVTGEKAEVKLPEISHAGPYFLRFYSPVTATDQDLLREFRFEVK